jgi:DNA-directed RNA polymerase specialized sigma24 family protein
MPVELPVVWTLRELEGHSIEEVADLCEISRSTAKRRIASAQEFLSKGFGRA